MTIATSTEVVNLDSVALSSEVTNGLVPDQVIGLKERVIEINDELRGIGQSMRAVAANLYSIKENIKPGNWRAFLNSGAVNCSTRQAIDLVSAHEKWLGSSSVEDHLLSGLTARSLMVMGSDGVTERQRQKVFELVEAGEKVTESTVRYLVKGRSKTSAKKKASAPKTESVKIAELNARIDGYKKQIKTLQHQNRELRKLHNEAAESLIEWENRAAAVKA